jgi:3-phenylpropionate/trans-cinnamate dioxygenase ferredoxin subunit
MPEEFVKVAKAGQLPPGRMMLVELGRFERILLVNVNGSYHAVDELCPHSGAALSEGDLYGEVVECPLHSSMFRVKTGEVLTPPASEGLTVYQVRLEGDDILVGPPQA